MERNDLRETDIIDLGQASVETKGAVGKPLDEVLGIPPMGLSAD
jgi:hypothetical protein